MSRAVETLLADMDVEHVPIIAQNPEENGVAERFNLSIMNAVWEALRTAGMDWSYWTWALLDAVDKYNQLPHGATGNSPHETWFADKAPSLQHLYIFGQLGYVPVMAKKQKQKHRDRGKLVRYLRRDGEQHIWTESATGEIRRYRGTDFHPYFDHRDPATVFHLSLIHI